MDVEVHQKATELAIGNLPEWQRKIIKPVTEEMIDLYSIYPDIYKWKKGGDTHDNAVKYADYSLKETEKYSIHHFIPYSHEDIKIILDFYLGNMAESLSKNNLDDFAKFAGAFSHSIIDVCSPAHIGEEEAFVENFLIPPPEDSDYTYLSNHWIIEAPVKLAFHSVDSYSPQVKGNTLSEVLFFLREDLMRSIRFVKSQYIPVMQAFFRQDIKEAFSRELQCVTRGVEMLSNAFFNVINLSSESHNKKMLPKTLHLTELLPQETSQACTLYWGKLIKNHSLSASSELGWKKETFKLLLENNGAKKEKEFTCGFGMGVPTKGIFVIDKLFEKFTALVGFHSVLGEKGIGYFKVLGDDVVLFESKIIKGSDPALTIEIPLHGVCKLELVAFTDQPRLGFDIRKTEDHLVLADPVLTLI